jgi:hypothetical protein
MKSSRGFESLSIWFWMFGFEIHMCSDLPCVMKERDLQEWKLWKEISISFFVHAHVFKIFVAVMINGYLSLVQASFEQLENCRNYGVADEGLIFLYCLGLELWMFTSLCCRQNWDLMVRMDVVGFHLKFLCNGITNELMRINSESFNARLCLRNQSSRLLYKSCLLRRPCQWSSYLIFLLSTEPVGVWRCFCPRSSHYKTSQGILWLLDNKFQFSEQCKFEVCLLNMLVLSLGHMPTKNGTA